MKNILIIIQLVISILLIVSILVQGRGAGLGASLGGQGELYRSKRGVEKILFYASIVLVALFLLISIAILIAR